MKNGQCPKCDSHEVFSNTNRKFPALNTLTIGSGTFGNRYAYLDTYVCANCGYVENYVAKQEDLNHIKQEWALVEEKSDRASDTSNHSEASSLLSGLGR
jgi:predicted nucleic-acid-binding Zn-ribbon protein